MQNSGETRRGKVKVCAPSFRGDANGSRECAPDDRLRTRPGISRFSDVQLHIGVRCFASPRNDDEVAV
jgi:hypothetical protein